MPSSPGQPNTKRDDGHHVRGVGKSDGMTTDEHAPDEPDQGAAEDQEAAPTAPEEPGASPDKQPAREPWWKRFTGGRSMGNAP
jgi:hypothetical protein